MLSLTRSFAAVTSLFIDGIHYAWPSPSVPILLSDEYPFDITKEDASYITLISFAGNILGTFLTSYFLDALGRRKTLLLIGVPQFVCFSLTALYNYSPILLYCARFIGGISDGACFIALPIYVCEVTEPKVRGILGCCITLIMMLGIVLANIFGNIMSIMESAILYATLPVIYMIVFWFMPESPYYCVMKGKTAEAKSSLQFLRRKRDVEKELMMITKDVARQLSESSGYMDLIRIDSNRRACIAAAGLRFIQQFTGIASFIMYAQILFQEATDSIPPQAGALIFLLIDCVVTVISMMFVDKIGRIPLIVSSLITTGVTLVLTGIFMILQDHTDVDVSSLTWVPLLGLILYTVFYSYGIGMVVNLMQGEVFSASIKGKAMGVMNIWFAIASFSSTKFFQYSMDQIGLAVPFLSFGIISLLGALFSAYCVPETKGKTLEEIQQELKGNKVKK